MKAVRMYVIILYVLGHVGRSVSRSVLIESNFLVVEPLVVFECKRVMLVNNNGSYAIYSLFDFERLQVYQVFVFIDCIYAFGLELDLIVSFIKLMLMFQVNWS